MLENGRKPDSLELDLMYAKSLDRVIFHMDRLRLNYLPVLVNEDTRAALVIGDPVSGMRMWHVTTVNKWGRMNPNTVHTIYPGVFSDPVAAVGLVLDEAIGELADQKARTLSGKGLKMHIFKTHTRRRESDYKQTLIDAMESVTEELVKRENSPTAHLRPRGSN